MPQVINATDARNNFADIINQVIYQNREFVVQKKGKPAVLITKISENYPVASKKITTNQFLIKLAGYKLKTGKSDLAKNHDKYTWE